MLNIPLSPVPAQTLQVPLNNQQVTLKVYQTNYGLFIDVYLSGELVIGGVICENLNRIVRSLYLGFSGDLGFQDTQGSLDPYYTGLGTRFLLWYLYPSELPAGEG